MRGFALVVACGLSGVAHAQSGVDFIENIFGASNVRAIAGHGGLTLGVSREGDLTVLAWPGPASPDQLAYLTSNALDARAQPRFGAEEGAGAFVGLVLDTDQGEVLTWLRDRATWTPTVSYGGDDGPNVVVTFRSDALGLTVQQTDAVHPTQDLWVRRVEVVRDGDRGVSGVELLAYANLSPLPPTSQAPELPFADVFYDGRNDYAAAFDARTGMVLHGHPDDERIYDELTDLVLPPVVDWGVAGDALSEGNADDAAAQSVIDAWIADDTPGAWLAWTTVPAPTAHHVGQDRTPFCAQLEDLRANVERLPEIFPAAPLPIDPAVLSQLSCRSTQTIGEQQGWDALGEDTWTDLQDGELGGASLAAGETASSLRTTLAFDGDTATGAVVLSAARTAGGALTSLADAPSPQAVADAATGAVVDWLATLRVPGAEGTLARRVAQRSLLNLRTGTDATTGAVVASITRQPPYGLDWPRDGAFFNVLLAASGQADLVDRRTSLYADWQRTEPVEPTPLVDPPAPIDPRTGSDATYPAHAWEMNHYADGTPGGNVRFEIDNTAFAVWTMVTQVGWTDQGPDAYLRARWGAIRRGADLLAAWRDPETGLHAPAQEDDNPNLHQTLHGAATTFAALDVAARAARLLGEDDDAERWEDRATELRDAILDRLVDDEAGVFLRETEPRGPFAASGRTPTGTTAWAIWPMTVTPWDDPLVEAQLQADWDAIAPNLFLEDIGGAYYMKNTATIAAVRRGDPAWDDRIDAAVEALAAQATPDTHHFGEVMVVDGDGLPEQRVATPHLWEGTLFALTVLAAEDPMAVRAYDLVLPPSRVLPAEGCGCATGGRGALALPWLLALVAIRRRSGAASRGRSPTRRR